MTYSIRNAERGLFEPERLWRAKEISTDPKLVPDKAGIYGWWFDRELASVPFDGTLERDGMSLLYVGIAPSAPSRNGRVSKRTLRDRLKNHTRGPIATSTLRRTVCSVMAPSLELVVQHESGRKPFLSEADEAKLTSWMTAHAGVAWIETDTPWMLEDELITVGPRLPLNIRGSKDPFRSTLTALRALQKKPTGH